MRVFSGFFARSCHNSRKLGLFAAGIDFLFHFWFCQCDFGIKEGKRRDFDARIAKIGYRELNPDSSPFVGAISMMPGCLQ